MLINALERRVRTRHLVCFLEVSRAGSIVSAAELLGISQPAVTRSIKELEEILQVRLFDRGRKGVRLTQYGEAFLHYARGSIAHLREGISQVASVRDAEIGSVRIGVLPTATAHLLPLAIRRLKAATRLADIMVVDGTSNMLIPSLKAGDLDFIIGRHGNPEQMIGLSFEHLYFERMCIVLRPGHPEGERATASLQDLIDYTWIIPPPHTTVRREIEFVFGQNKTPIPQDRIESVSYPLNRAYVLDTDALCVAPFGVFAEDIRTGALVELPVDMTATHSPIGITSRADGAWTHLGSALVAELRQVAADLRRRYGMTIHPPI